MAVKYQEEATVDEMKEAVSQHWTHDERRNVWVHQHPFEANRKKAKLESKRKQIVHYGAGIERTLKGAYLIELKRPADYVYVEPPEVDPDEDE